MKYSVNWAELKATAKKYNYRIDIITEAGFEGHFLLKDESDVRTALIIIMQNYKAPFDIYIMKHMIDGMFEIIQQIGIKKYD